MQMRSMEARTVLRNADVPIGASLVLFAQWLGELSSFPWGKHVNDQTGHGLASTPGFDPQLRYELRCHGAEGLVPQLQQF
jgi:hypothetical protein